MHIAFAIMINLVTICMLFVESDVEYSRQRLINGLLTIHHVNYRIGIKHSYEMK